MATPQTVIRVLGVMNLMLIYAGITYKHWAYILALAFFSTAMGYVQAYETYFVPEEKKKNGKTNKKV